MEKIEITFLGTSGTIPTATRNHTAIHLKYKYEDILIDCGEGTQRQFRKARLNPCKLTKLLITHRHGDHVLGIVGLLKTLKLNGYDKVLDIYGPVGTKKFIDGLYDLFMGKVEVKVKVHEVSGKFFENDDFELIAGKAEHVMPTNAYAFLEKDKLRIDKKKLASIKKKFKIKKEDERLLSNLIKGKNIKIDGKTIKYGDVTYLQKGRKVSFVLDTAPCSGVDKLVKGSDLAIIESTFSEGEIEQAKKYKHMTAKKAGEIAKKGKVKELILTHISQRFEYNDKGLISEAKDVFKNVRVAKDLMRVEV